MPHALEGHNRSVNSIDFSPDDTVLVSASGEKTIRLRDGHTGQAAVPELLEGHTYCVKGAAFGPGSQVLASAPTENMVRLWDIST